METAKSAYGGRKGPGLIARPERRIPELRRGRAAARSGVPDSMHSFACGPRFDRGIQAG